MSGIQWQSRESQGFGRVFSEQSEQSRQSKGWRQRNSSNHCFDAPKITKTIQLTVASKDWDFGFPAGKWRHSTAKVISKLRKFRYFGKMPRGDPTDPATAEATTASKVSPILTFCLAKGLAKHPFLILISQIQWKIRPNSSSAICLKETKRPTWLLLTFWFCSRSQNEQSPELFDTRDFVNLWL